MESESKMAEIELQQPDRGEKNDAAPQSIFAKAHRPIDLKFEDVVYKIKTKEKRGENKGKQRERVILNGISGTVYPGEMMAMLGPSGSGKTTLLTVLAGRVARTQRLTGSVTYNGKPFSSSLRRRMGFVMQDDVLYPHLTVTETLVFTALLRLPGTLSRREKAEKAEAVIEELGLTACRDSIIGGPFVRGVSGGERKRVSIGQEMLINPSLLFLDEPTSGLDSTIAGRIVSTLADLAKGGRTVTMTIHQPSSRLFYMFHKILLLSEGNAIYYGRGSEAMGYFASIGYSPAMPMNPADFLLDLANGISFNETVEGTASTKEALVDAYNHHLRGKVAEELSGLSQQLDQQQHEAEKITNQWCTTWWQQFTVLLQRGLKERRHETFAGRKVAQVIISALIGGILWYGSAGHIQDQAGLLFFIAGFWAYYASFQAIFTFPQERTMLSKERSSGMYRLSSYFIASTLGDLPMELSLPIAFVTITYWLGGLKPVASSFLICLSALLLSVLVAQSLGLAIGAFVTNLKSGSALLTVLMVIFQLASGFYVQNVPPFISWVKYVSFNYYTFKLQIASQYSPTDTYQCTRTTTCPVSEFPSFKLLGFDKRALSVIALFLMMFIFRFIAYLGLLRVGIPK
ncbi:ABC transporter G family member 9-like [Musa acuminata AAA Group]|uniref:ABC transporter G family member 9-like n=1 Tax=Musa acuminata AAA Group TaxID=214697 RepID=UPI0031DFCCC8